MTEPHPVLTVCDAPGDPPTQVETYLACLFRGAPPTSFIEIRWRLEHGMGQTYVPVRGVEDAGQAILTRACTTDMYVGVAPRVRRGGSGEDVDRAYAVWADCDTAEALDRLCQFTPAPSMLVRSGRIVEGGGPGVHAYWLLSPEGADAARVEMANRRLAEALDADRRVYDRARVLRPPGSLNFKYDEPQPVTLCNCTGEVFALEAITASLPHLPETVRRVPSPTTTQLAGNDPLKTISPQLYIPILTGEELGRDRKIGCPFHDDATPSLHVYDDSWFCFGCEAGGSIIDFGAHLYGLRPRGADFHEIRRRLATDLLRRSPA